MEYIKLSPELKQTITPEQAWYYKVVPYYGEDNDYTLCFSIGTLDNTVIKELEVLLGRKFRTKLVQPEIIEKTLSVYYRKSNPSTALTTTALGVEDDDFIEKVLSDALYQKASDIHIEIYEGLARVRFRIDGKMVERYLIGLNEYPSIVNKFKIKANLDIAEKRLPQDGRISYKHSNNQLDIRVSVIPAIFGEKIVLRLLGHDATEIDIHELGFFSDQLSTYIQSLKKSHGLVLVSGPTGSGKTTTLYATLKILNKEDVNILTIEDPVEYTLRGINQVQVKESIGLDFATSLRTFLRQDPDIIMIGEIRDSETAQMAIRAALTGHLVLSTIHTNSGWGTVARLIDMGIPSYLLADTLTLTIAQRLVRILCPICKTQTTFSSEILPPNFILPFKVDNYYKPVGCPKCFYTGYSGRKAVYELIPITFELADCIKFNLKSAMQYFEHNPYKKLSESAFDLFAEGSTSSEEIYPILLTT